MERLMRSISFVYSPDDGGYYAEQFDYDTLKSRVTRKIYSTETACRSAVARATEHSKVWEEWT
jgi:hypothetical protein